MSILREATRRRAPKASRGPDLTSEEQARVKVALAFLAKRHGTYRVLAKAMGLKRGTVVHAVSPCIAAYNPAVGAIGARVFHGLEQLLHQLGPQELFIVVMTAALLFAAGKLGEWYRKL